MNPPNPEPTGASETPITDDARMRVGMHSNTRRQTEDAFETCETIERELTTERARADELAEKFESMTKDRDEWNESSNTVTRHLADEEAKLRDAMAKLAQAERERDEARNDNALNFKFKLDWERRYNAAISQTTQLQAEAERLRKVIMRSADAASAHNLPALSSSMLAALDNATASVESGATPSTTAQAAAVGETPGAQGSKLFIYDKPWREYLDIQFPATIGHKPLNEFIEYLVSYGDGLSKQFGDAIEEADALRQQLAEAVEERDRLSRNEILFLESRERASQSTDRIIAERDQQAAQLRELQWERDDWRTNAMQSEDYVRKLGVLLKCADGDDAPEIRIEAMFKELRELQADKARIDKLSAMQGCALTSDDHSRWAIAGIGFQTVPGDEPADIDMHFFVPKADWKQTIREAIDTAPTP